MTYLGPGQHLWWLPGLGDDLLHQHGHLPMLMVVSLQSLLEQGLHPRLALVVPFTMCTSTQVKVALNGVPHFHHLLDVQVFATWMAHELSPSLSATHLGRAGASKVSWIRNGIEMDHSKETEFVSIHEYKYIYI